MTLKEAASETRGDKREGREVFMLQGSHVGVRDVDRREPVESGEDTNDSLRKWAEQPSRIVLCFDFLSL